MKRVGQKYLKAQEEKRFVRRYELVIVGVLILLISSYCLYAGEIPGRSGGIGRSDYPVFYWVFISICSLMGSGMVITHFTGRKTFNKIADWVNNKKL